MATIRGATTTVTAAITDMATTDMAATMVMDTMVTPAMAITGQQMAIEAVAVAAPPEAVIEEAILEGTKAAAVDLVEDIREASEAIVAESGAAGAVGFRAAVEIVSMEEAVDSTAEAVGMAVVTVADATEKYSIGGRSNCSGRIFNFGPAFICSKQYPHLQRILSFDSFLSPLHLTLFSN